jgi:AbrB family looped-hinge helix DNA binding protein
MENQAEAGSLTIDQNGRVVIPAGMRKSLGIKPGDKLAAFIENDRLVIMSREALLLDLRERFRRRPGKPSVLEVLRRERAREVARERKRLK